MFKSSFQVAACLCVCLPALHAEPSLIISPNSIAGRIHAQNPSLAAARLRIHEALGKLQQAGRPDNPELEVSAAHDAAYRERRLEVGISQRFPLTDRLRLEKTVSATEVKAAEAEVMEVERQLVADARVSVVKILAFRQRRELMKQQSALYQDFSDSLGDAAKRGEGSAVDAGLAKLEAASLITESKQLDAAEAAEIGALKPLLGMKAGEGLSVSGSLEEPAKGLAQVDPARRPDFQAAKLDATAAAQAVQLERAKKYADVEAGLFASAERTEDAPEGYRHEGLVGLRFKIPLPLWDKNEGNIAAAQATQTRKELEAVALSRNIRLEAEAARAEMDQWAELNHELRDTLMPLAEQQSTQAEDAYRGGQGEIQAVLRSREKRLQLAAARLDALRDYHLARVRYQAAIGTPATP